MISAFRVRKWEGTPFFREQIKEEYFESPKPFGGKNKFIRIVLRWDVVGGNGARFVFLPYLCASEHYHL